MNTPSGKRQTSKMPLTLDARFGHPITHVECHTGSDVLSYRMCAYFVCVQTANKKAELLRQVDAQHQYEKLLEQYEEFLATAENKIKSDEITAVNLPALKQQSDDHKASKD